MGKAERKNPRIDFYLPVTIKGHQGLNKVIDLSMGGLLIQIEDTSPFKIGDEVDLVIKLPHEKNAIQVKARVARVIKEGIGVEFIDLSPRDQMSLEYCFHVFKSTVPLPNS
ncbi:MAG: PilZ domain-containing protein [Desulfobacterales bacterium]|nr:PilZ domain-containing protein [Desulfobacterales bacterium]